MFFACAKFSFCFVYNSHVLVSTVTRRILLYDRYRDDIFIFSFSFISVDAIFIFLACIQSYNSAVHTRNETGGKNVFSHMKIFFLLYDTIRKLKKNILAWNLRSNKISAASFVYMSVDLLINLELWVES